jgi:hypothetical protein
MRSSGARGVLCDSGEADSACNGQRLPEWPRYVYGHPVLHLDHPITSRPDQNRARYEFWQNSEK